MLNNYLPTINSFKEKSTCIDNYSINQINNKYLNKILDKEYRSNLVKNLKYSNKNSSVIKKYSNANINYYKNKDLDKLNLSKFKSKNFNC